MSHLHSYTTHCLRCHDLQRRFTTAHVISFWVCAGGKVEWGHLAAGDAALNAALHQDGRQYDMLGEEVEALLPATAAGGVAPMGRGRDAVKPAWMTDNGAAAAPGSGGMPP